MLSARVFPFSTPSAEPTPLRPVARLSNHLDNLLQPRPVVLVKARELGRVEVEHTDDLPLLVLEREDDFGLGLSVAGCRGSNEEESESQQRESPTQNISSASQQEIQRTDVSRVRLNVRNDERLLAREGVRANALARARSYLLASRSTVEGTQQEKVGRFACS